MRTQLEEFGIEWSVRKIRESLREGMAVHCERQSGKTTALLEWVHELVEADRERRIGYASMNMEQSERAAHLYRARWPDYRVYKPGSLRQPERVLFVTGYEPNRLRGQALDVVVDDWWMLTDKAQDELRRYFKVIAAVGTIPAYSAVRL